MKRTIVKLAFAAALAVIPGCKNCPDCFFVDGTSKTNSVPASASFSDERYIWESWFFSTNAVPEKVVK